MKLVTLNIWGGKIHEPLIAFLKAHSEDIDIFCFQDLLFGTKPEFTPLRKGRANIFQEIGEILSDHKALTFRIPGESHFHDEILAQNIGYGQAIFLKNSLNIADSGGFRSNDGGVYAQDGTIIGGRYQWVKIKINGQEVTMMNVHGLWQKDSDKKDTPERIRQSQLIQNFLISSTENKILCGDFNLAPDTESIKILEKNMNNLIKERGFQSTRSSIYEKPGKFADYVLVSSSIKVNDFKVMPNEVSDHLPLYLDFTL